MRYTHSPNRSAFIALACVLCIAIPLPASGAEHNYVHGEVLVRFVAGAKEADIAIFEQQFNLVSIQQFTQIRVFHYKLPQEFSVANAIKIFNTNSIVEYAEPNYSRPLQGFPTDPRFSEQWSLHNSGQLVNGIAGSGDIDIDWPEAMDIFTQTGEVIVAVLDSGIALDHPEIFSNTWVNNDEVLNNGVDDDNNGYIDDIVGWDFFDNDNLPLDENGHGTLVASQIVGVTNNGEGGVGVAPYAKVMALRVTDDFGSLGFPSVSVSNFLEATTYAAQNGAQIINASFGGPSYSSSSALQIIWLDEQSVLLVAAAGNGGADSRGDDNDFQSTYPASYSSDNVIAVAALDRRGDLAVFSNFGANSVDIAAPGTDIFGASLTRSTLDFEDFESGAPGWTIGTEPGNGSILPWSLWVQGGVNTWLTDSVDPIFFEQINYQSFTNTWAKSPSIDLSTSLGPQLSFTAIYDFEFLFDGVLVEASANGITWDILTFRTGNILDDILFGSLPVIRLDLSRYEGQTIQIRFRVVSDATVQRGGVAIDNFLITKVDTFQYDGTQYQFLDGTSFAAPLVSGVAAMLLSQQPDLTHLAIKQIILDSVDASTSLNNKVVSGGRLNARSALLAAIATGADDDNDGVPNDYDNCPSISNAGQNDADEDGEGNACDTDDDNDGVADDADAFPLDPDESVDSDLDGVGNNTDTDDDGDGILDKFEKEHALDPLDPEDASQDVDDDGFTNLVEFRARTDIDDPLSTPETNQAAVMVILDLLLKDDTE